MVHVCYRHQRDQAQYALCDLCAFRRHDYHDFCNLALECELFERFLVLLFFQYCPSYIDLREMRAESYVALGELGKATGELRTTVKLTADNTKGYLRLSLLHYQMGEEEDSLL